MSVRSYSVPSWVWGKAPTWATGASSTSKSRKKFVHLWRFSSRCSVSSNQSRWNMAVALARICSVAECAPGSRTICCICSKVSPPRAGDVEAEMSGRPTSRTSSNTRSCGHAARSTAMPLFVKAFAAISRASATSALTGTDGSSRWAATRKSAGSS